MSTELLTGGSLAINAQQVQESIEVLQKTRDFRRLNALLVDDHGSQVALPASLTRLLESILRVAASGGTITYTVLPSILSSSAAAQMLGISRPTLMKFARSGDIAATFVGSHARFTVEAVEEFAKRRQENRLNAFGSLRDLTIEMNMDV